MKPQVMLLLGVLAYALFANKVDTFSATPAKGKKKKLPSTTPTGTKVTNITSAKKKKKMTAAQKELQAKRRAM